MTMPSSTCFRTDTICFAGKDLHLFARLSGKELNDQKLESRISDCADIGLGNRASVLNPVEVDPNSPSGGATSSVSHPVHVQRILASYMHRLRAAHPD